MVGIEWRGRGCDWSGVGEELDGDGRRREFGICLGLEGGGGSWG